MEIRDRFNVGSRVVCGSVGGDELNDVSIT